MKTILATGLSLVSEELAKLPDTTRVAVVTIARKDQGQPVEVGAYVAYRPGDQWRVDAGASWVQDHGWSAEAQIVFAR